MIRKFLTCGKQLFLSSKKHDDIGAKIPVVELQLPIQVFWEIEAQLKRIDYMLAANEDPVLVADLNQRILRRAVKYVVQEKDRVALFERINGAS